MCCGVARESTHFRCPANLRNHSERSEAGEAVSAATVIHNDVVSALADVADNTYDAILADPPYGLSFMGKRWDYDVPDAALWREVLRVCKPGAALVAFSGTRTYHRSVVQIEDAGFEVRDCLAWMYGSGFPKSMNISIAIDKQAGAMGHRGQGFVTAGDYAGRGLGSPDRNVPEYAPATDAARHWHGYGTALKPSFEPAVLARKPIDGTVAANVERWGVGALAIDASRIEHDEPEQKTVRTAPKFSGLSYASDDYSLNMKSGDNAGPSQLGRWPSNVLLDADAGAILDAQAGERPGMSGGGTGNRDASMFGVGGVTKPETVRNDTGGASRFFYCPKASREERELGCRELAHRSAAEMTASKEGQARLDSPRTGAGRTGGSRTHHPTVKPVDLMRYLARLIMPPSPGRLLVPFAGSGSEMIGAILAGWPSVTGIEREAEYVEIARARVALALTNPRAFEAECEKAAKVDARQLDMFGRTGT
jgi:DNA modification methylase